MEKVAGFADALHELIRVLEAARRRRERRAVRRIAAKRQDVAHPELARVRENRLRLGPRRVHARQMGHRRELVVALDSIDDGERLGARAAAGAVGDRTEIGREAAQRRHRLFEQGPLALIRSGREELDGNGRLFRSARIGQDVANESHRRPALWRVGEDDCQSSVLSNNGSPAPSRSGWRRNRKFLSKSAHAAGPTGRTWVGRSWGTTACRPEAGSRQPEAGSCQPARPT